MVPSTGQPPGSSSPGSRIFSTVIHCVRGQRPQPLQVLPRVHEAVGVVDPQPVMPASTQRRTSAWVASNTASSSTRTPASVVTAKNRR